MEIETFHETLSDSLQLINIMVLPDSLLAGTGNEMIEMARCYLADGSDFIDKDDPVNALASFAYAAGWLDTGISIGVFTSQTLCKNLLSHGALIPDRFNQHLVEKAFRYQRLFDSAILSSTPGSETGIHWYDGGERVIAVAAAYSTGGRMFLQDEQYDDALACFSYGHGWLDAALRVGLIRIGGNRDLFAI